LLANGYFQSALYQFIQIVVQRVIGKSRKGDGIVVVFITCGESNIQDFGSGDGIIEECLVKIAHSEQDQFVGMRFLHLIKLA
jgi:hypothetical protein